MESQVLELRTQREDVGLFLLESGKCLVQNSYAKPNQIFEIVRGETFCESHLTRGVVSILLCLTLMIEHRLLRRHNSNWKWSGLKRKLRTDTKCHLPLHFKQQFGAAH